MKSALITDAQDHITDEAVAQSATNLVESGSVLIVVRSGILQHTLPVAVTQRQVALNQDLKAVTPRENIRSDYLALALKAFEQDILHSCTKTGTTVQSLELPVFLRFEIPVAPLPEQQRIVAEIEKQFTRLEAGVAALRRVQANLKRYRAAVLKAACEGRLVPTEAELAGRVPPSGIGHADTKANAASGDTAHKTSDYETGEALLQWILAERRKNWTGRGRYKEPTAPDTANLPPLPEGWTWASVAQTGEATTGSTPPKGNAVFFGGNIPFFKPTDLDAGFYVRESRDSLTESGAEHGRLLPKLSILVTCIGATIGKAGFARVRCATNQQINALTVPSDLVSPEYVFWFFNSPFAQEQIKENASATTLPILNKSKFEALPIPLPPLAEQTRIAAEVERRLSLVEELESVVTANLQRATRLRQSILQNAFTGGLV